MEYEKPVPVPDATSAGFWEAARAHVLAIQACRNCGKLAHPPALVCAGCHVSPPVFHFQPVRGPFILKSWTEMHDTFLPGFRSDLPFTIGLVEMQGQPEVRLLTQIRVTPGATPTIDAPVGVEFIDAAEGVALPRFVLGGKGAAA